MLSPTKYHLVYLILLLPFSCLAQFTITGKVLNQADTKPVPNASVFLSNATIGDQSAGDGTFILKNVPAGRYDLVISIIGFETYRQTVLVNGNIKLADITIFPKTIALKGVTIKADPNRDKNFNRFYPQFKKVFLGPSGFAMDCIILNPEVLDFDYDDATDVLSVSSAGFLRVENKALGYNLNYLFTTFKLNTTTEEFYYEGNALFTEMKGDAAQQREWQQSRGLAYEGSMMHFLRSALKDRLDAEGFRVLRLTDYPNPERPPQELIAAKMGRFDIKRNVHGYNADSLSFWRKKLNLPKMLHGLVPTPLKKWDLVGRTAEPGVFLLGHNNEGLVISYDKQRRFTNFKRLADRENLNFIIKKTNNNEITLVDFGTAKTLFDGNGRIVTNNTIKFNGAWSNYRAPQFLPVDYVAPQNSSNADTTLQHIENKLNAFAATHITEKVHLHLDRPWYGLGDTIWMKAYTVAGDDHRLTTLSGVLYAELINPGDTVVQRLNLPLNHGLAMAEMIVPYTYKSGTYRLRAYTRLMMDDSSSFYDQKIVIGGLAPQGNSGEAVTTVSKTKVNNNIPVTAAASDVPDVQFFPEGGDLVNGVRSKVGFKAISRDGNAAGIRGMITDQDGAAIAPFGTQHGGMGMFWFTPQAGKQYKAKITCADGSVNFIDLPKANNAGFTLAINGMADSISIKVEASEATFKNNKDARFYVLAQVGGKDYYTENGTLSQPIFIETIEKSAFPTGVARFTLFSQNGEPLCERVVFIQNNDQLKLTVSAERQTYTLLEKVQLSLGAKTGDEKAAIGTFSVSVTDETKVPVDENAEGTIFTDLLLSPELKGHIDNPGYYFTTQAKKTRADLDLLMLTQGYRRFEWRKILTNKPVALSLPETFLSLSGTVSTLSGKPVANGKIRITSIRDHFSVDTISDAKGNFTFEHVNLDDTAKIIIDAKKANGGANVKINMKQPAYPVVNKLPGSGSYTDVAMPAPLRTAMKQAYNQGRQVAAKNGIQLKEVKIKETRNLYFNPKYGENMKYSTNLNGAGNANQVLMGDKLTGCAVLSTCLLGKLNGVTFTYWEPDPSNPHRSNLDMVAVSNRANTRHLIGLHFMSIFIDGRQMGARGLNLINPDDVYSIEVLTSGAYLAIYGSNAPDGALIITLKHGSESKDTTKTVDGLITYNFTGYYKAREFYSQKYDTKSTTTIMGDRKTIYWNPDIVTDANGKATFGYFNAGTKGTYRVVVEGIDGYGNLGRQVFRYKVE